MNLCNSKKLIGSKGDMYLIQLAAAYEDGEEFMDTTTAVGGIGSTIGNAYYLKNAKSIIIEITADLTADDSTCHTATI